MVATLYFMEDLTYEEISHVLECPVGTVRSRLHRGSKMLQKALWQVAQEDGIVRDKPGQGDMMTKLNRSNCEEAFRRLTTISIGLSPRRDPAHRRAPARSVTGAPASSTSRAACCMG